MYIRASAFGAGLLATFLIIGYRFNDQREDRQPIVKPDNDTSQLSGVTVSLRPLPVPRKGALWQVLFLDRIFSATLYLQAQPV